MAYNGGPSGGSIPQDLELIMQMVGGEAAGPSVAAATLDEVAPTSARDVDDPMLKETETDSEASSDSEDTDSEDSDSEGGDSEEDSDEGEAEASVPVVGSSKPSKSSEAATIEIKVSGDQLMTEESRAQILAQLDSWQDSSDAQLNADGEGYITADSEEQEDDESEDDGDRPDPAELAAMEDDDDEPAPSGPLVTANEVVEEPVRAPAVKRLRDGAPVVFAGDVVHYVPDPAAVKAMQRLKEEAEESAAKEPAKKLAAVATGEDAEEGELQEETADQHRPPASDPASRTTVVGESSVSERKDGEVVDMKDVDTIKPQDATEQSIESDGAKEPVEEPATASGSTETGVADEDVVDMVAAPAQSPPNGVQDAALGASEAISIGLGVTTATDDSGPPLSAATVTPVKPDAKGKGKAKEPKILSSGKVVIRAMRPPEGVMIGDRRVGDDEGWLEEGSLVCFKDGRVIATVAETFGPLTSPFYLLRLPPPPFPMPTADELAPGTAVYYSSAQNRSYVPVRLLRTDKRFKGSDASNRYDEEVGDDEREWSDDEEEAAAKRGEKLRRQGRTEGPGQAERGGPSRMRHYDDAAGGDAGGLDYGGDAMDVDDGASFGHDGSARERGRGRGGARGGDRGRGARGGRGGRGGGPSTRFEDQGFGQRGRGRGGPIQRGGLRPHTFPVAKPSDATITMAETIGRRDGVPQAAGRPDGAPVAPLPARPPVAIPAAPPPQQQAYTPQMHGFQGQGPLAGFPQPPQWNPQQMGYGMMPQAGYYGGMPGFGGPQAGYPAMYGGVPQAPDMGFMPQAFGYPGFAPQGAAINPRFMAQAQAQGLAYSPQLPGGPNQQQPPQPPHQGYYPGQQGQ